MYSAATSSKMQPGLGSYNRQAKLHRVVVMKSVRRAPRKICGVQADLSFSAVSLDSAPAYSDPFQPFYTMKPPLKVLPKDLMSDLNESGDEWVEVAHVRATRRCLASALGLLSPKRAYDGVPVPVGATLYKGMACGGKKLDGGAKTSKCPAREEVRLPVAKRSSIMTAASRARVQAKIAFFESKI